MVRSFVLEGQTIDATQVYFSLLDQNLNIFLGGDYEIGNLVFFE
jgi:hypothetical protein